MSACWIIIMRMQALLSLIFFSLSVGPSVVFGQGETSADSSSSTLSDPHSPAPSSALSSIGIPASAHTGDPTGSPRPASPDLPLSSTAQANSLTAEVNYLATHSKDSDKIIDAHRNARDAHKQAQEAALLAGNDKLAGYHAVLADHHEDEHQVLHTARESEKKRTVQAVELPGGVADANAHAEAAVNAGHVVTATARLHELQNAQILLRKSPTLKNRLAVGEAAEKAGHAATAVGHHGSAIQHYKLAASSYRIAARGGDKAERATYTQKAKDMRKAAAQSHAQNKKLVTVRHAKVVGRSAKKLKASQHIAKAAAEAGLHQESAHYYAMAAHACNVLYRYDVDTEDLSHYYNENAMRKAQTEQVLKAQAKTNECSAMIAAEAGRDKDAAIHYKLAAQAHERLAVDAPKEHQYAHTQMAKAMRQAETVHEAKASPAHH